jgi:hypothetical protein
MNKFRGVFAKFPCIGYFLNYLNYFSKEKAWTESTVPWTESTGPVYGSIGFIKQWSLITGLVVQTKSVKGYALVLISCIGSQMNGHEFIQWGGGALAVMGADSRRGAMAAHRRWGHGGYGAPFTTWFLPTASEQCGELVSLTLGSRDELYWVGGGNILHYDLADVEEPLRSTSGFKNGMRSLLASTSHFYAGSIAPSGSENRARWLLMVWRVPQLVGENPSTIGRYL